MLADRLFENVGNR